MSKFEILRNYEENLINIENIIGSTDTTNNTLDNLGNYLFGDQYLGTYSSNDYPKRVKNNECFIVNTDPNYKSGIHWCGVYKYKNKFYVYDSFDRNIHKLSRFWKNKKNWISANKYVNQSYNEYNCGSRSMAWLISSSKYTPKKIMNII
jgi:hypothetical protein